MAKDEISVSSTGHTESLQTLLIQLQKTRHGPRLLGPPQAVPRIAILIHPAAVVKEREQTHDPLIPTVYGGQINSVSLHPGPVSGTVKGLRRKFELLNEPLLDLFHHLETMLQSTGLILENQEPITPRVKHWSVNTLEKTAPEFLKMAHEIVWATVATVDSSGRPRSRILHPIWEWDGASLVGWIATQATPIKRAHLKASPYTSVSYWTPNHDTCVAECHTTWANDDETRQRIWNLFLNGPEPVGYDPSIVPGWTEPTCEAFAVLKLEPWRLRVFPGTVLLGQGGELLNWASENP